MTRYLYQIYYSFGMETFVELMGCDGTALYEITGGSSEFRTSGRLIVEIAYDGMIRMVLNDWEYLFDPKLEIQCDRHDPQFEIVLSLPKQPKGKWLLKINEMADEVFSCLNEKFHVRDKHFKTTSYSSTKKNSDQEKKLQKPISEIAKRKQPQPIEQPDEQEGEEEKQKQSAISAKSVVVGASKGIGIGLGFAGKILGKGFEAIGTIASKIVKPKAEKVEVSEATKANLDLAKKASKNVLSFTATQVGNLLQFGKETASNIGERLEKTEKGKSLQQNPKYETVKQGTKTGVQVLANLYDGVVTAVYEMGSGISKGTTKVVQKKYGEEAGEAADSMMEGVGNVIKLSRVPTDQAYKTFK